MLRQGLAQVAAANIAEEEEGGEEEDRELLLSDLVTIERHQFDAGRRDPHLPITVGLGGSSRGELARYE